MMSIFQLGCVYCLNRYIRASAPFANHYFFTSLLHSLKYLQHKQLCLQPFLNVNNNFIFCQYLILLSSCESNRQCLHIYHRPLTGVQFVPYLYICPFFLQKSQLHFDNLGSIFNGYIYIIHGSLSHLKDYALFLVLF